MGTPNTQSSTSGDATKPIFSVGVGATTTSNSGCGGTSATSTGFGSFGAPATSTAAPSEALGATPDSTAPFLFGGPGFGDNAAKPTTGFGITSFGNTPTCGSAAPTFDSAAPTINTNTLGGTNTSGTKTSTEPTGFGNILGSAPQFGQTKFDIHRQSEQAIQRAADESAKLRPNARRPTLRKVVVARRKEVGRVLAALSPEEEVAWARVIELTSQRAAPPAPLDNDPDLGKHPSVEVFRNVPGVEKNIYFFTLQDYKENHNDNHFYTNHKEADMTLALANYLMQQGYTADDITILAAYSGQMFYMRQERQKYASLSHVKIRAVYNYQGEESKIIILSLVRNKEKKGIIGLLGSDNGVCVALSRAKEGLYIFGNINMMKKAKSGLWTKIATTLQNSGCLGTTLNLKCQTHPDEITTISAPGHFFRIPKHGGCFQKCNYNYDCGHKCQLPCHGYDREHINTKCTMKCERVLCERGHVCPLLCCVDCMPCWVPVRKTLPCGLEMDTFCHLDLKDPQNKCLTKVDVTLPDCEHQVQKYCYEDINEVKCLTPCEYQFECGYVCRRYCHVTDDPNDDKVEMVNHMETALSPEEEAAWARVNELTSQLAVPLINDRDLGNHTSVKAFGNVPGVEKKIYFFNHDYREQNQNDNNSCANHKEANMTLALANYLMQQGYTADDITILAAYGQMFYMRQERQKYASLTHVKITAIDNYQEEESKIILLSLVRNNEEHVIGSLGSDNRVCVALSRAKQGLYIFGNINMMKAAKSGLWAKIATTLEHCGCLGTRLILKCQYHPDQITTISTPEDFLRIKPDGGCIKKCYYQYDCGHKCQLLCHQYDREHIKNKCTMQCKRVLCELGHVCPLLCGVDCEPCQVDVRKNLPCGHEINTFCHLDLEDPRNKCLTKVDFTFPDCEHKAQKFCYQDINEEICLMSCEYRLECGHVCGRICHVTDDLNHEKHKCVKPCECRIECGHVCEFDCHGTDDPNHNKVVARRKVVGRVQAALTAEEEAALARVNELTSQLYNDPDMGNPPSVEAYRNVPGVEKNIYFFTHDYSEENQNDNNSCANHKEADMTLALANYLMQQGYTADDITILATYSGQMFYMRKNRQKYAKLSHVKITAVDNYQGEESKIILLSLVRNKEENIIGFIGTDNRVCIALSRAKEGLYIFGNINMLKTAKSGLWTEIATTLEHYGCFGRRLILKCQYHPDRKTTISTAKDFQNIKLDGRCFRWCDYQYACGHNCQRLCHRYDREHINTKCTMKCERLCELGHACPLDCGVDCKPCEVDVRKTLPCGHEINTFCHRDVEDPKNKCFSKVDVTLPDCKHKKQKYCYQNINEVKCFTPCEYRLECGHVCGLNCHVTDDPNHEKHICEQPCDYRLECGHVCESPCHMTENQNHEDYICRKPCARANAGCVANLLGDRGDHQCRKRCYEKCDDCNVQVDKVIPECLHTIKLQCKQSTIHELCNEKCKRQLSCGHPCLDRCGAACDPTKCTKPSFTSIRSPCGHRVRPPCNVSRLFAKGEVQWEQLPQYCSTPCGVTLACKHLCAGSCFGCAQGRLHQPCTQQCNQYNICGHQCQEPCNQICQPCKMPCEVKCVHSRCMKLCCEPCTPCQEKCKRKCVHGECSHRCGEPCSRAPCSEQCALLRPCGHRCRGLCGEPCPDICQLCRPDEFPKDLQDEQTAKYIVLHDCDHVFEVDSMDRLMMGDQKHIQIRKCPFCRKAVINTNRYKDIVNKMLKDINQIKLRVYGTEKEIRIKLEELKSKFNRFVVLNSVVYGIFQKICLPDYLIPTFSNFSTLLDVQKNVSLLEVEMEFVFLNIFEMIVECWKKYDTQTPKVTLLKDELMEHIKLLLEVLKINPQSRIPIKISEQQQNDVGNEIKRLNVIVQLSKLLHLAKGTKDEQITQQVETTKAVVFSLSVFNEDRALESLKQLQKVVRIKVPVTKYERELIVKAICLKAGHWYKCPNGHYYCIEECGGAMALGRCPEAGCRLL